MRALPEQIVGALRASGALPLTAGVTPEESASAVAVELAEAQPGGFRDARLGALQGARVAASGQVSLWWSLPRDSIAAVLDGEDLLQTLTRGLRLAGSLRLLSGDRFAVAVGLSGSLNMISEGRVSAMPRTGVSIGMGSGGPVRVQPDESVSTAAFDRGADEVAGDLVRSLLAAFRSQR